MQRNHTSLIVFILLILRLSPESRSQGNIDWEEMWVILQPPSPTGYLSWMAGDRQYTGIAYDRYRNALYVVNPSTCTVGSFTYPCPRIRILDPLTGQPMTTIGRDAITGQGGVLPTPVDTILAATIGWPDSSYGGFNKGQFALYKIDVDDEGRIFACNLVMPLWGECFPGPPPNCDPSYLKQGPFRIYRWDTPSSTPKLVYATLNAQHTGIGTLTSSEMIQRRWGDALDVVGKRVWVRRSSTDSVMIDSARIFVAGGYSNQDPNLVDEIAVFLADTMMRTPQRRISNGAGGWMDYRLGIRLLSPYANKAGHGIAVTGSTAYADIWMDHSMDKPRLGTQRQTGAALPQTWTLGMVDSVSTNPVIGAGPSGPLAFMEDTQPPCKLLVTADAQPSGTPNYNTRARILLVTTRGQPVRQPGYGDTPYLGIAPMQLNGGAGTWISDVDYMLEPDIDSSGRNYVILFVMMSSNGIAAYRSRNLFLKAGSGLCTVPVELRQFTAIQREQMIALQWTVERETNNRGFDIQRSFAGSSWESIGFVNGRGTASHQHGYGFDDPITATHFSAGRIMYRLKQIDMDGSFEYSPTAYVHVGASSLPSLEQCFPNPVSLTSSSNGFTTIRYTLPSAGHATLTLCTPLGEEVRTLADGFHEAGVHSHPYPLRDLAPGIYVCRLVADDPVLHRMVVVLR